jgi:hypothetical protein
MIDRCHNPDAHNFRWYGATGVSVCERWRASFDDFVADVGERPKGMSLDRFPNKAGNYEPGNVRWATRVEQGNNARNNLVFSIGGRSLTLKQWSREFGVNYLQMYRLVVIKGFDVASAAEECRARPANGDRVGSDHGNAKLTEDVVAQIRASREPSSRWAARTGVSVTAIHAARSRKTWKHVVP